MTGEACIGWRGDTPCPLPVRARAMCHKHYEAWRRGTGGTLTYKPHAPCSFQGFVLPARIANKLTVDDADCWLWTGALNGHGYGVIKTNKERRVHRFVYETLVGPVPEGLELDHLCRVRRCCNPTHLEPVTHAENVLRGVSPMAQQARQTHCIRGHEFTPENTYLRPDRFGRQCRTCNRARWRTRP